MSGRGLKSKQWDGTGKEKTVEEEQATQPHSNRLTFPRNVNLKKGIEGNRPAQTRNQKMHGMRRRAELKTMVPEPEF